MIEPFEYVRSVGWVLAVWAASAAALAVVLGRAARRLSWADLRAVARDEDGAAYSISYVMAVPVYVLLLCLVVETSIILLAKIGSVYAAFAAARNHAVYRSFDPPPPGAPERPARAHRAAVRALAPFGSSDSSRADGSPSAGAEADAADYAAAARRYEPALRYTGRAIRAGYLYADKATTVTITKLGPGANDLLEATVTYRVPLRMPGAARLLGVPSPAGGNYYVAEVKSVVRLPDEAPQTPDGKLNIRYDPPR